MTDRKFNRLCEPKAASGREASEGQGADQGSTESGADISQVSGRASACRRLGRPMQTRSFAIVNREPVLDEIRWSTA